jgi:hypothetical protein
VPLTSASPGSLRPGAETANIVRSIETPMLGAASKSSAIFGAKLGMDCYHLLRLRSLMEEQQRHRREVIGRLFAILTARLEDAADLAVRGQDHACTERQKHASALVEIGQEVTAVSEAILLLLGELES